MSQFEVPNDYQFDHQNAQPQTTSGLAISSLICSLIACCPIITLLGPILGAVAIIKIGSPPKQRGKGLAVAGIAIGIITTTASTIVAVWLLMLGVYTMQAPQDALSAGMSGDIAGFKASFSQQGAAASDEEARDFLEQLEARYGAYRLTRPDEAASPEGLPDRPEALVMQYFVEFENQTVPAEAEVQIMARKIDVIIIRDSDLGDLQYPPAP